MEHEDGKVPVRSAMKAQRKLLSRRERDAMSREISRNAFAMLKAALPRGARVAVYIPVDDEVDVTGFIRMALEGGFRLYAPKWNGASYSLAEFDSLDPSCFVPGKMGIPEPASSATAAPREIDFWLVPGLAFGRDGSRIGYGGGWYDRFLSDASPRAPKVGVAYPFSVFETLPAMPHDAKITAIASCRPACSAAP